MRGAVLLLARRMSRGVAVEAYHGSLPGDDRLAAETKLQSNEIKALVAYGQPAKRAGGASSRQPKELEAKAEPKREPASPISKRPKVAKNCAWPERCAGFQLRTDFAAIMPP